MKCDKCGNDAEVEITIIDQDKSSQIHLCSQCYKLFLMEDKALGKNEASGFQFFQEILSDLIGSVIEPEFKQSQKDLEDAEKRCTFCNSSFKEFIESGKFGCDHCYIEFYDKVSLLLTNTQGDHVHNGKVPKKYLKIYQLKDTIAQERQRLNQLVIDENFEQAAKLRDEILSLNNRLETMRSDILG